jgi:peroxiredoxin
VKRAGAAALALFGLVACWLLWSSFHGDQLTGRDGLPAFRLVDLQQREWRSEDLQGKVLLLNFWAAWCPPCRREIPDFVALQRKWGDRGVQFVGIALDNEAAVRAFVEATPVNYPILIGDEQSAQLAVQLGNRSQGLPFSVLFDRDGNIVMRRTGLLTREMLEKQLSIML